MANTMEQLGSAYLSNATNVVLHPLRHAHDADINQINQMCT
jgi:hypothetical protein